MREAGDETLDRIRCDYFKIDLKQTNKMVWELHSAWNERMNKLIAVDDYDGE